MSSDFVMIVAKLCSVKLDEVIIEKGSPEEKELLKVAPMAQYPMLEVKEGTILCDSFAIASYLARTSNTSLLGAND